MQRHRADGGQSPDGRHPTLLFHQPHLAHDLAGTERREPLVAADHLHGAFLQHEDLEGEGALLDEHVAGLELHVAEPAGRLRQVVLIELAEQRQVDEALDLDARHRAQPSGTPPIRRR